MDRDLSSIVHVIYVQSKLHKLFLNCLFCQTFPYNAFNPSINIICSYVWVIYKLQALLQKADILYQTQDYDVAYIYYSRGHKVYPKNKGFIEGMKKTEHEIGKFKRGKGIL